MRLRAHRSALLGATTALVLAALAAVGGTTSARAASPPVGSAGHAMQIGMQSDNLLLRPDTWQSAMREMHHMGVSVLRVSFSWRQVAFSCAGQPRAVLRDPDGACYDWKVYDPIVAEAKRDHIQLLFSIGKSPVWASSSNNEWAVGPGTIAAPSKQFTPTFHKLVGEYADFVHAAVAHYGKGSRVGEVRLWTIWNEPNSRQFWVPFTRAHAPEEYAEMYRAAAPEVKAANPRALVAAGPTGPNSSGLKPGRYVPRVLAALDAGKHVPLDAWAHNPYPGGFLSPRDAALDFPSITISNVDRLYQQLDASRTAHGKPVWFTEFSYQTNPPDKVLGIPWSDQADWIGDYFDIAAASKRVPIALWYVLRDPEGGADDWQSGLETEHGAHKPAYTAYQRPVGLDITSPRGGSPVNVWGASTLDPLHAVLVVSVGGGPWRRVAGQHHAAGGGLRAVLRPDRTLRVAVQDREGVGRPRLVDVPTGHNGFLDQSIRIARPATWNQFAAVAGTSGQ